MRGAAGVKAAAATRGCRRGEARGSPAPRENPLYRAAPRPRRPARQDVAPPRNGQATAPGLAGHAPRPPFSVWLRERSASSPGEGGNRQKEAANPASALSPFGHSRRRHPATPDRAAGEPIRGNRSPPQASGRSGFARRRCPPPAGRVHPPVTLIWRATAGRLVRRSMTKSCPLGLRAIAASMAARSSSSLGPARTGARRSAASSWPRHM